MHYLPVPLPFFFALLVGRSLSSSPYTDRYSALCLPTYRDQLARRDGPPARPARRVRPQGPHGTMAFVRSPDRQSIELLQKGEGLPLAESWKSMRPTPGSGGAGRRRGPRPSRVAARLSGSSVRSPSGLLGIEVGRSTSWGCGGGSRLPNQGHRIDQPSPNFGLARWPWSYWVTLRDSISM